MPYKLTRERLIKKFIEIHGNSNDYSLLDKEIYNYKDKIKVICKNHGTYTVGVAAHLHCQCRQCYIANRKPKPKKTKESYVKLANIKHKNKYSYDKFIYNGSIIPSIITCPTHGDFSQSMNKHVNGGGGCPRCGYEFIRSIKTKSHETFLKNCVEKYGDIYDLSKIKYINKDTKITPICKIHGVWEISARCFLKGSNCPRCKMSSREKFISSILTENKVNFETQKKFPGCKNILSLSFDFFIPKINTLIEYDGEQHFKPCWAIKDKNMGVKRLKETRKLDRIKTKYAKSNNIQLIRIPYTAKDTEIRQIILKLL